MAEHKFWSQIIKGNASLITALRMQRNQEIILKTLKLFPYSHKKKAPFHIHLINPHCFLVSFKYDEDSCFSYLGLSGGI